MPMVLRRALTIIFCQTLILGCGQGLQNISLDPESADLRSESAFDPSAFDFDPRLRQLAAEVAVGQIKSSGLLQPFRHLAMTTKT